MNDTVERLGSEIERLGKKIATLEYQKDRLSSAVEAAERDLSESRSKGSQEMERLRSALKEIAAFRISRPETSNELVNIVVIARAALAFRAPGQ